MSFCFGWLFIVQMLSFNSGNSKVMKLLWYGRCCCTCTSSTLQIGITAVQCPSSSSCMVLFLQLPIQCFILVLASKCIISFSFFSAFRECTRITNKKWVIHLCCCSVALLDNLDFNPFLMGRLIQLLWHIAVKKIIIMTLFIATCKHYAFTLFCNKSLNFFARVKETSFHN